MSATATLSPSANGTSNLQLTSALRVLKKLDFEKAEAKAIELCEKHPEWGDKLDEALAEIKARDAKPAAAPTPAAPITATPAAAPKEYTSKEQVLKALASGEITDVSIASALLIRFEKPAAKAVVTIPADILAALCKHCTPGSKRTFSSGNEGWYVGGKGDVNGVRCQIGINVVVLKDKPKK